MKKKVCQSCTRAFRKNPPQLSQKKKMFGTETIPSWASASLATLRGEASKFLKAMCSFFSSAMSFVWKKNESYATTETSSCATVQLKMLQKSQRSLVSIEMFDMDVSENSGTPKSSILIGFSIRNHPFWGIPIFGTTRMGVRRPKASAEKTTVKTWVFWAVDDQKQLNFWSSFSWISKNSALATVFF